MDSYSIYESLDNLSNFPPPRHRAPLPPLPREAVNRTKHVRSRPTYRDYLEEDAESRTGKLGSKCANFCSCVKSTVIIALIVTAILGLFVILPLKVIFIERMAALNQTISE